MKDVSSRGETSSLLFIDVRLKNSLICTKSFLVKDRGEQSHSNKEENQMRKMVISAIAVASLIGAVSAANAGWWDALGYYHPFCYWGPFGYLCY
jgi:hypothetical protein